MARIRTIKPEFWSDEKLSECSLSARLLFIGLISFADDEGRLDYSPARIRMQVFPCGSAKPTQLSEWLGELRERSLIRIYEIESREYLDIPNFLKHQKINRPTPSKLPPMTGQSMIVPGELSENSPLEGNGMDHGMEGKKRDSASRSTANRLPDNFGLTEERAAYASAQRLDPQHTFENFRDYWTAASGAKARKNDWDATWRIWCRREHSASSNAKRLPPANDAAWAEAKSRAQAIGFREPLPVETPASYMTAIKQAENTPRSVPIAERRGLSGLKRACAT